MPFDVRKRCALPSIWHTEFAGRPQAFRTSNGTAVPLKEFLGNLVTFTLSRPEALTIFA